jgi:ribonucleoside-diphosphate reductase alpha chain
MMMNIGEKGDMILSESSNLIFKNRYAIHEEETWQGLSERVGQGGAQVETDFKQWQEAFASDIYNMLFLPGGRILRNVGRPRGSLFNCYVEPLDDSMRQIGQFQMNCGILWSEGGGVGCNASFLRPEDAPIIQKGGESSGPISFLKWANAGANCIKTGGARRAAALAMMNVSHPDIIKFINAKLVEGELNCFNISAAVTEDFLQAVEADDDWDLKWKTKVWQTVKAREIWNLILDNMVKCAEPGLINWDNLRSNNSYYFDPILCFTGDTLISTTKGLIKIKDLVDKKINTISDLRVIGSQGTFIEKGIGFKSGTKEVFEVVLKNNQKIKLTSNHKVWTKNGWKEVKDLEINKDYMCVQNSISQHFVNNIDNKEDFDNGYMIGLLVGDGWLCNTGKSVQYGFCFHESEEYMMNFVEEKINHISNGRKINWHRSSNSKSFELTSSSKAVNDYFKKWGYTYKINEYGYISGTKRSSKFISNEVLKETPSFKRGFLSGLYDSDGSIQRVGKGNTGKGKKITLVTSKNHIAERVQIMLNEFGIPSSIGSRITKLNGKSYIAYTVNINRTLSCNSFKRLIGFKHSEKKYKIDEYKFGSKWNEKYYGMFKVKSIKSLGEQEVYDVETNVTHSLIANGIIVHNSTNPCGEVPLGAHGVCCLGSLVLPNFITGTKNTNWQLMERTVHNAIRFLDNIIQINRYVIEDVKRKAFDGRRIGIGVMGLAEYLFAKNVRYGSKEATRAISTLMENVRNFAYEASCKIAEEKEPFPKFDVKEYSKAHFFKTLPASLRMSIKKHGIRNVTLMAVAPTGTISLIPEVTSSIEPLFCKAYIRNDEVSKRAYIHPIYKDIIERNQATPNWYVDSFDLKPEDHFETQVAVQKYLDGSVSKTINCPKGFRADQLSDLLLEYIRDLKGVTLYVDGSREGQILNPMIKKEARKFITEGRVIENQEERDCSTGACEI